MNEQLKQIDEVLTRIRGIFEDYRPLTPTNLHTEYDKFIANNRNYAPQLTYEPFDAQPIINELQALEIPTNNAMGQVFGRVRNYLILFAQAFDNIGTNNFITTNLFGEVNKELYDKAQAILQQDYPEQPEKEKTVNAQELGKTLLNEIASYGLEGWDVEYKKNTGSVVNINGEQKHLLIRADATFSEDQVRKLIVHEIGTHALRAENGRAQDYKIFSAGLPGYLPTEEGLAAYNEELLGVSSPHTLKRLARNVIGTHIAGTRGFMEVYKAVLPYCKDEDVAFRVTARFKRGLADTSKPGGFLKDHAYLEGYLLIKTFVAHGGDIKKLYAGKIRINDLYLLDEGIINPPSIIPHHLE